MDGVILSIGGRLEPLRQGELDGLCGLYAAINAIRLVLSPWRTLGGREERRLFGRGVALLAGRNQLVRATLTGFDDQLWPELVDTLAGLASAMTDVPIVCTQSFATMRQPTLAQLLSVVDDAAHHRRPVLIQLGGRHRHYTVVSGTTRGFLQLFDSGYLQRLRRNAFGVDTDAGNHHHVIRAAALIVLELRQP